MDAKLIGGITYELIREFEDRIRMQHEDERARFLRVIERHEHRHEKEMYTAYCMKKKFAELKKLILASKQEQRQMGVLPAVTVDPNISEVLPVPSSSSGSSVLKRHIDELEIVNPTSVSAQLLGTNVQQENASATGRISKIQKKQEKFEEVIRKKSERANLTGRSCEECGRYFKSLEKAGFDISEMINTCSRHRTKYTPPATPEGYWDLSIKENCWDTT